MGGHVKNVYATNLTSGKIDLGAPGIETDVLYQWRTLVPTYEKRLTPIANIFVENVTAGEVKFVSRILGQRISQVRFWVSITVCGRYHRQQMSEQGQVSLCHLYPVLCVRHPRLL